MNAEINLNLPQSYPELKECMADIERSIELLEQCFQKGGMLLLCGNGGSAADCEHIAGELLKGFLSERPLPKEEREALLSVGASEEFADYLQQGLPVISLTGHPAFATAYLNDVDGRYIFAQQVNAYGKQEDVLLAISTSGNSEGVCNAVLCAKAKKMKVIGLTGRMGGRLAQLADVAIKVPEDETYRIQERHLPVYHYICAMIEKNLFGHGNFMNNFAVAFPNENGGKAYCKIKSGKDAYGAAYDSNKKKSDIHKK